MSLKSLVKRVHGHGCKNSEFGGLYTTSVNPLETSKILLETAVHLMYSYLLILIPQMQNEVCITVNELPEEEHFWLSGLLRVKEYILVPSCAFPDIDFNYIWLGLLLLLMIFILNFYGKKCHRGSQNFQKGLYFGTTYLQNEETLLLNCIHFFFLE